MRKWLLILVSLAALLILASVVVAIQLRPRVKARLEKILAERFDSGVQIGSLSVRLFPKASVTAGNISLRYRHRMDIPPLITIGRISASSDLATLLFGAQHDVSLVRLQGLRITIAPGMMHHSQFTANSNVSNKNDDQTNYFPFVIHRIVADGAVLVILPKKENRVPLEWDIEKLTMTSVGPRRPMNFVASLTNAKPPGMIQSAGTFGPWQKQDPGSTHVGGHYTFKNADMGVFKGLNGILSSVGDYTGALDDINVNGTTDIPNFQVGDGNPVDLKTKFSATVDGTNGDTELHPVDASFMQSEFICQGGVVGTPGVKGRTIDLNVVSKQARLEDILLLVLNSKQPPLVGDVDFQSKLVLPPRDVPVIEKLFLKGRFALQQAHFTSGKMQEHLDTWSDRSRGVKDAQNQPEVASNMKGRFELKDSVATLTGLSFGVPGILIALDGTYGLRSEQIDFHGGIQLQGRLSAMITGWKSLLLKAADPFFRRDGKTVLPIKITGTKSDPKFGLDFHRDKNER
ncbi:MAG: hypothetical protein WAM39_08720 [Bryobacteraceae bacterium]